MKKGIVAGIIGVVSFASGFILGGKFLVSMINDYKKRMERNLANMMLFNDWLEFLYSGGSVVQYFKSRGYKKIMIYGSGYISKRLVQALEKTNIQVATVMDKADFSDKNEMVAEAGEVIPMVDCIVITPVFYYDEIVTMLQKRTEIPIVSMQLIIDAGCRQGVN